MRKLFVSVLTLVLLAAASAFAIDETLFNKLDRDRDGRVTREEFIQCDLVRTTESNGKQVVKERSLCAQPEKATTLTLDEKRLMFDQLDANRKGSLTRKDFYKYSSPDGFVPFRF